MAEIVSFGEWVQIRRETLRLTRRQLADNVVCSPVTIKKIERDERRPSRQIAKLLAEHLQIPASDRDAFLRWARGEFVTGMPRPDGLESRAQETEPGRLAIGTSQIPHNLPIQSTPFIGREEELDTLDTLLVEESRRLVSIVGPGGMGKTRLALACAESCLTATSTPQSDPTSQHEPHFPQGIFFVDLAPLSDPDQIAATVAEALDFQPPGQGSVRQQLLHYLQRKRLLLLLDNFEHLLDDVDLVTDILHAAPTVQILVTSRERLHLHHEQVYPIEGLEFPDWETPEDAAEYTAVQLFLQSARRNRADFNLREGDDLTYLARICRLVAGMPLAIELAAAWVDTLPLEEIAAEIQQNLDFLETDMRDVPDRHRSIRAAIDGSWEKLTADEQTVFAQMSVFRGGFTRKAGQAVAQTTTGKAASLPMMSRLVNKSFLRYNQERERFQIHELLRQYGAEKLELDEMLETAVRDRHSHYYCQALHKLSNDLKGGRQKEAYGKMVADSQNIFAAWRWAVDRVQVNWLEQAAFSLRDLFNFQRRIEEGRAAFQSAIDKLADSLDANAIRVRSILVALNVLVSGNLIESLPIHPVVECLQDLKELEKRGLDVDKERALTLQAFSVVIQPQEPDQAQKMFTESLNLYHRVNDTYGEARILYRLGRLAVAREQYSEAKRYLEQSLVRCQKYQNLLGEAESFLWLGRVFKAEQDYERAIDYIQDSLKNLLYVGHRFPSHNNLRELGILYTLKGLPDMGHDYLDRFLSVVEEYGETNPKVSALTHLSWLHILTASYDEGSHLAESARRFTKSNELVMKVNYENGGLVPLSQIAFQKGDYSLAQEYANIAVQILTGKKFFPSQLSYAQIWLGWSQLAVGQMAKAEKSLLEALSCVDKLYVQEALLPLAYLLAQRAQTKPDKERALALIGLYEATFPLVIYPFYEEIAAKFYPDTLAALSPEQVEAAKAHGRSLDLAETVAELQVWLPTIGWGQLAE